MITYEIYKRDTDYLPWEVIKIRNGIKSTMCYCRTITEATTIRAALSDYEANIQSIIDNPPIPSDEMPDS